MPPAPACAASRRACRPFAPSLDKDLWPAICHPDNIHMDGKIDRTFATRQAARQREADHQPRFRRSGIDRSSGARRLLLQSVGFHPHRHPQPARNPCRYSEAGGFAADPRTGLEDLRPPGPRGRSGGRRAAQDSRLGPCGHRRRRHARSRPRDNRNRSPCSARCMRRPMSRPRSPTACADAFRQEK